MSAASLMLMSLLGVPVHAQRSFTVGVEGGAAVTNFVGVAIAESEWRTSPWIGVTVITDRPGAVGLQSGVQLVSKGIAFPSDGMSSVRLRFVEVPVLLRLGPSRPASRVRPVLLVGGTVGVRVGCSVTGRRLPSGQRLDCDNAFFGPQVDVQRFDAGLTIGGEVGIPYRKRLVLAPMARFTRGLVDIGSDGTDDYSSKNAVFQLGLGLRAR